MVGTQIGVYKITHLLGEGGMGTVYEAVHEQLGKRVAIKVLRNDMARNSEGLTRFFNEARAVNLIEHPGLVQIFEFGELPSGSAYLVMEHLQGETLSARLKRRGQLPEPEALYLCYQLAAILAAAHERGIVHRDLKPSTVQPWVTAGPAIRGRGAGGTWRRPQKRNRPTNAGEPTPTIGLPRAVSLPALSMRNTTRLPRLGVAAVRWLATTSRVPVSSTAKLRGT